MDKNTAIRGANPVRRSLTVFLLVCGGAAAAPNGHVEAMAGPPELELTDVSQSVVTASSGHGANMTCIALDSGLVFVDAGLSTSSAADFRARMEARFDQPSQALLLTHAHLDHFIGMRAFSDLPVVAASAARPLFERQLAIEWNERAVAFYSSIFPTFAEDIGSASPFLPTVWMGHDTTIGEGAETVLFVNSGGHTSGSSYVYYPAQGVVVSGDLVQAQRRPYFGDPSTDLAAWIETLDSWQSLPVKKVCPGHGPVIPASDLAPIEAYFVALRSALRQLKSDDLTLEEAIDHPSLPEGYWPPGDPEPRWWRGCIAAAWRGL